MVCRLLCQISDEAGVSPRQNRPLQIEAQYQDKSVIVQVSAAPKLMCTICFCKCFHIFVLYYEHVRHISVFSIGWLWYFVVTIVVFKQEVICSAHGKGAVL